MARYRGFVGQVSPLGGLGITRSSILNGERTAYFYPRTTLTTNKITPTIAPTVSTVPGRDADGITLPGWFESYCVPGSSVRTILPNGYSTCPMIYRGTPTPYVVPPYEPSPAQQELEYRQYAEGGDGTADILETTAKIDEAIKRVTDDKYADQDAWRVGERVPFDVKSFSMWHPDDVASKTPIMCMRTHPDIRLAMAAVCTPNQAYKDKMAAMGLKTTLPVDWSKAPTAPTAPTASKPNWLPLVIGAGLIWFMS